MVVPVQQDEVPLSRYPRRYTGPGERNAVVGSHGGLGLSQPGEPQHEGRLWRASGVAAPGCGTPNSADSDRE